MLSVSVKNITKYFKTCTVYRVASRESRETEIRHLKG